MVDCKYSPGNNKSLKLVFDKYLKSRNAKIRL